MPARSRASLPWLVVVLLFFATLLNYLDRQTLSVLSQTVRRDLHLGDRDYAWAVSAFLLSYGVMYAVSGALIDRIGYRRGVAISLAGWSFAGLLTAAVRGAWSLIGCRFLLGLFEPAIYPAALKAVSHLFDASRRALAMGILSSGSAAGAILAPPLVAWMAINAGWRMAFLVPGAAGLFLVIVWLRVVSPGQTVSTQGPDWRQSIRQPRIWALVLPRMFSDPVWYFYLFWLPDYLQRERGLTLGQIGLMAWVPFAAADLGAIGGGALSDWLIRRGWQPGSARRAVLYAVGTLAPLAALAAAARSVTVALAIISFAAMLTQAWSVNIATHGAEEVGPPRSALILGLMGSAGSLSGALFTPLLAWLITDFGYSAAFLLAASMHPIAALLLALGRRLTRPLATATQE